MVAGCHKRARTAMRAIGSALVAACALTPAASGSSTTPPSSAAFDRATDRLLEDSRFERGSGGIGAGGGTGFDDILFPDNMYVTLYGAPQLTATVVGKKSPRGAVRGAVKQAAAYERETDRGVVPGIDLVGVVANSTPGPDRKYRTRQPDTVIEAYLEAVRAVDGRLMLDIQPGRSTASAEVVALRRWMAEPDVDVGIDPEWNVGPKGVPGQTTGVISATEINKTSARLDRIVEKEDLPPKVLIVHQFTKRMIRNRAQIRQRPGVQVVLNFDGIGSPAAKENGFTALATEGLFNGFSIFLTLDTRVMTPAAVLGLLPTVDFLLYQ